MKEINISEIEELYRTYDVSINDSKPIRTSLNQGTLNNKLNCDYSFVTRSVLLGEINNQTNKK